MTFEDFVAGPYIAGFNGLRAISIMAVLVYHSFWHWEGLPRCGFLGVDMFFVISGFLIGTLLLRERAATGGVDLPRFWLRRIRRLLPALYVMLGLMAVYFAIRPTSAGAKPFFDAMPVNMLLLSNWLRSDAPNLSHLWTLAAEEQFYILWPLALAVAPRIAAGLVATLLIGGQFVALGAFGQLVPAPAATVVIKAVAMYMPIALGVAAAHLLRRRHSFSSASRLFGWAGAAWAIAALILALLLAAPPTLAPIHRLLISFAMFALLLAVVARPHSRFVRLLEWPPFARIGIVSYGIYLYHYHAMHVARRVLGGWVPPNGGPILFGATLVLAWVVAEVSYRWLELPAMGRRHGLPAASPAY